MEEANNIRERHIHTSEKLKTECHLEQMKRYTKCISHLEHLKDYYYQVTEGAEGQEIQDIEKDMKIMDDQRSTIYTLQKVKKYFISISFLFFIFGI